MKWRPFSENPSKTGRYIVKHRGNSGADAYYTARKGDTHYPVGWAQLPEFGATHWLDETGSRDIPMDMPRLFPEKQKRKSNCKHCRAKGYIWWQLGRPCPKCGGEGWFYIRA